MTSVDELLATMSAPATDKVILPVDEDLRIITIPSLALVIGAQGDKNVNRIYFKMNRYYRGTDFAKFTPRVNYINALKKKYHYDPADLVVENDSLMFSWLIRGPVAQASGEVTFSICMRQMNQNEVDAEFNTTTAGVKCLVSIDSDGSESDIQYTGTVAVLNEAILDEAVLA